MDPTTRAPVDPERHLRVVDSLLFAYVFDCLLLGFWLLEIRFIFVEIFLILPNLFRILPEILSNLAAATSRQAIYKVDFRFRPPNSNL
jgi:hypothetical protein